MLKMFYGTTIWNYVLNVQFVALMTFLHCSLTLIHREGAPVQPIPEHLH